MRRLVEVMRGHYRFEDGRFVPDEVMSEISARLRNLKLLADTGPGVPSFYLDPRNASYWECVEFEDYSKELREVDRKYIEDNYPTVDPDRAIT